MMNPRHEPDMQEGWRMDDRVLDQRSTLYCCLHALHRYAHLAQCTCASAMSFAHSATPVRITAHTSHSSPLQDYGEMESSGEVCMMGSCKRVKRP